MVDWAKFEKDLDDGFLDPSEILVAVRNLRARLAEFEAKLFKEGSDAAVERTMRNKAEARLAALEEESRQLREALYRLGRKDGMTTMEVNIKGGTKIVGHGVVVTSDQSGENPEREDPTPNSKIDPIASIPGGEGG